jgi:hypothetical protein
MHKLFRTLALMIAAMLVVYMIGCSSGADDDDSQTPPSATTVTADPPSGSSVPSNATIALTLDQAVDAVASADGSAKAWTIAVAETLTITWTNKDGSAGGPVEFTYTLKAEDNTAPSIIGGSVSNGDIDVDPAPLNADKIEITFNEAVSGTAALNFEDDTNAGWQGAVSGTSAQLTPVAGKELANSVTYKIVLDVRDGAGNTAQFTIEFATKAKE